MIGDAQPQYRGVAEPEGQAGQKADLRDVDRIQSPRRIDPISHRAAGENAGADIVPDRIAGEGGKRVDAVGNVGAADRANREQIIECQREITRRHEQAGQRNLSGFGVLDGLDDLVGVDAAQHVVKHIARDPDDRDADRNTQLMQDLLLAQKRDRPAYCFQHLDLELRSHVRPERDLARRKALMAATARRRSSATLPWYNVVARFGPEWNSLGVNKTRILQYIREEFMTPDAQFCCIRSDGRQTRLDLRHRECLCRYRDVSRQPRYSSRRRMARNHPVAQPRSDRAAGQIQREHHRGRGRANSRGGRGPARASAAATSAATSTASQRAVTFETPWPR